MSSDSEPKLSESERQINAALWGVREFGMGLALQALARLPEHAELWDEILRDFQATSRGTENLGTMANRTYSISPEPLVKAALTSVQLRASRSRCN